MNLLVDTTYFLPFIGVNVRKIPSDAVIKLIDHNEVKISNLSLFELSAKGAKIVSQGILSSKRLMTGLKTVETDARLVKVPYLKPEIMETAIEIRKTIPDFIDCLILSSALTESEILVTEDQTLLKYTSQIGRELVQTINPEFKATRYNDLSKISG